MASTRKAQLSLELVGQLHGALQLLGALLDFGAERSEGCCRAGQVCDGLPIIGILLLPSIHLCQLLEREVGLMRIGAHPRL